MNLLSWNMRGLGAKIKRSTLRRLISKHQPSFIFIQETKLENPDHRTMRTIWNDNDVDWAFSPSQGAAGGLISIWQKKSFHAQTIKVEKHWIGPKGSFPSSNFDCIMVNIYNPCSERERAKIWIELENYYSSQNLPCLIVGDFNEVLDPSERGSHAASPSGIKDFLTFVQNMALVEIPAANGFFTWFRG